MKGILNEALSGRQILAGLIILTASLGISIDPRSGIKIKKDVFVLMLLSSSLYAVGALIFKFGAVNSNYWAAIFWELVGMVATALFLLFFSRFRRQLVYLVNFQNKKFYTLTALNESIGMIAGLVLNYAYLLAPLALVQLVGALQPVFVLLLGILLTLFAPHWGREDLGKGFLLQKIFLILGILFGSYLLFT